MELRKCEADCGWVFVTARLDGVLCNDCGNNVRHPRICKVGAQETDWPTLLRLARYVLDGMEKTHSWRSASAVVDDDLKEAIRTWPD